MKKGHTTHEMLLDEIRDLFNQKGTDLTLSTIAAELKVNRSMITNHFPKKRDLIYSLVSQYEEKLSILRANRSNPDDVSFQSQAAFYSEILDLGFSYRGVIAYVLVTPAGEKLLDDPFKKTYEQNIMRIRDRIHVMIELDLVKDEILKPVSFKVFEIQYMTLASTWFISYGLYYDEEDYQNIKPYILISLFNTYLPYLTDKGKQQLVGLRQSLL
jgi:AcrR family transcriptional regulator